MSITQDALYAANSKMGFVIVTSSGEVTNAKVSYSHMGAVKTLAACIKMGILSGSESDYRIVCMSGTEYMAATGRFF